MTVRQDKGNGIATIYEGADPEDEIFLHAAIVGLNITALIRHIHLARRQDPDAYGPAQMSIDEDLISYIRNFLGIDEDHASALSDARREEPGIVVNLPDGAALPVDGHHRVLARWDQGMRSFQAYCVPWERAKSYQLKRFKDRGGIIMPA